MRFLANENLPLEAVETLQQMGIDIASVGDVCLGADDPEVLAYAVQDDRILVTFDKDFGELIFYSRETPPPGIILLRFRLHSPSFVAEILKTTLEQEIDWRGHFSVVTESRIRVVPLLSPS
jgi:predicted nuclease of predicted toxin-antitoxin system